jgi:hypothetical protein
MIDCDYICSLGMFQNFKEIPVLSVLTRYDSDLAKGISSTLVPVQMGHFVG